MSKKPKVVQPDSQEDTQTIGNVEQMYNKFVVGIDRFRSLSNAPGLGTNTIQTRGIMCQEDVSRYALTGLNVDPNKFIESRTHAFYRMIGFPVVASSGRYYNAGHDPEQSATFMARSIVDATLSTNSPGIIRLAQEREIQFKDRRNVFAQQNSISIVYAMLMRNIKPFLMAAPGQDPFYEDLQTQPVAGRSVDLEIFTRGDNSTYLFTDISAVSLILYNNVSHILKPFIIIPEIEMAVTPNFKRRICVPFLPDVESTKSTSEDILKRPIIEYIIKQRLKATETDTVFIKAAEGLLQGQSNESSGPSVQTTLLALSGQDSIATVNSDIIGAIQGFTTVQTSTVNMLTKAIRSSIFELDHAIREFDKIRLSYNVQVLPHIDGPEFGGQIVTLGGITQASLEQQRIAQMKLTELISRRQSQLYEQGVGNESAYAAAVMADVAKDFNPAIKKQEQERDEFGRQAIQHLRTIEIVTGEVSGLGLVDILAIYTALWAIDIEYLIGFLDDKALARLDVHFPQFVTNKVQDQINGDRPGILQTLQEFEKILFNILTYADKILVQTRQNPRLARKGSVV